VPLSNSDDDDDDDVDDDDEMPRDLCLCVCVTDVELLHRAKEGPRVSDVSQSLGDRRSHVL